MKSKFLSIVALVSIFILTTSVNQTQVVQAFQAKAYYFSKSKMDLGKWGARLSEAQKKEVEARMKNCHDLDQSTYTLVNVCLP